MDQVELGLRRVLDFSQGTVTGPLGDHPQPHFLEQRA